MILMHLNYNIGFIRWHPDPSTCWPDKISERFWNNTISSWDSNPFYANVIDLMVESYVMPKSFDFFAMVHRTWL